jgi:hypothetical protein
LAETDLFTELIAGINSMCRDFGLFFTYQRRSLSRLRGQPQDLVLGREKRAPLREGNSLSFPEHA